MKKLIIFLFAASLLFSCSKMRQESDTENLNQGNERREETPEEIKIDKQLLQDLPASAKLDAWNLILVNPTEALDSNFAVDLIEVDNEQRLDWRIVDAWNSWKEAAAEAGHELFLASAYRDIARQELNFNKKVKEYVNEGLSEAEAREKAKEYLTEPGHSEHHTGLALDIVDEEWIVAGRRLETDYEQEASQKWLLETMTDYGFILRYPKAKEAITMIEYEPWHFRYVGNEHARFMAEHDLVLEEYIALIKEASS